MWERFFQLAQQVFIIVETQKRHEQDTAELKKAVIDLTIALNRLADRAERSEAQEKEAREKFALQLQVKLMEFEQRLASGKAERPSQTKARRKLPPARKKAD